MRESPQRICKYGGYQSRKDHDARERFVVAVVSDDDLTWSVPFQICELADGATGEGSGEEDTHL